jgi:hypothetical protein
LSAGRKFAGGNWQLAFQSFSGASAQTVVKTGTGEYHSDGQLQTENSQLTTGFIKLKYAGKIV